MNPADAPVENETAGLLPPLSPDADAESVLARIETAGIVGMGGGGFPTARKIQVAMDADADWLIGNGMSSEPGVTADRTLLAQHGDEVLAGMKVVARCLGTSRLTLAVPNTGPVPVPPFVGVSPTYVSGEESALVAAVTGRTVPSGSHATDVGVLVLNVATLFAIHDAVANGRTLRRRLVTVAGTDRWHGIGTPLGHLLEHNTGVLRVNGMLTGKDAPATERLSPTTFSVDMAMPRGWACIGCGWCDDDCPAEISPQRLHRAFESEADDASVSDCVECGACTAACPSQLDLVNEFRAIKTRMQEERERRRRADDARARADAKTERLAKAAAETDAARQRRLRQRRQW